jgi:hypothetical protein
VVEVEQDRRLVRIERLQDAHLRGGVVRNLPAAIASATFHPPVIPARTVPNLQDGPEESGIARVTVLALARVAEGGRVIGVEPNTTVGGLLVDVLGPALADPPPMPSLDLRPMDLDGGIGLQNLAVVGVCERPGRPLFLRPNMFALLPFRDCSDGSGTRHHLTAGRQHDRRGLARPEARDIVEGDHRAEDVLRLAAALLAASWLSLTVFSWWCLAHIDWSWPSWEPPSAIAPIWSMWLARRPQTTHVGFAFRWRSRMTRQVEEA